MSGEEMTVELGEGGEEAVKEEEEGSGEGASERVRLLFSRVQTSFQQEQETKEVSAGGSRENHSHARDFGDTVTCDVVPRTRLQRCVQCTVWLTRTFRWASPDLFAVSHAEDPLLRARAGAERQGDVHYHAGHPPITARGRWGRGQGAWF